MTGSDAPGNMNVTDVIAGRTGELTWLALAMPASALLSSCAHVTPTKIPHAAVPSVEIRVVRRQPRYATDPNGSFRKIDLRRLPRPQVPPQSLVAERGGRGPVFYPPAALRAEVEGDVPVTFTVGTDGRATECRALGGDDLLAYSSCRLVQARARFSPALDRNRRPVPAQVHWLFQFRLNGWRFPDPPPQVHIWHLPDPQPNR